MLRESCSMLCLQQVQEKVAHRKCMIPGATAIKNGRLILAYASEPSVKLAHQQAVKPELGPALALETWNV